MADKDLPQDNVAGNRPRFGAAHAYLSGTDGNVFFLMAACTRALREAGATKAERDEFSQEVMASSSYDEALQVMARWVNVS